MTPDEFIAKWKATELNERAAAQSHFIDLCRMLEEPAPTDVDPSGSWYAFERGATKTTGGEGWADVWKRGHFGWEYKGKRKDLDAAFAQLQQYALALENPPLLIVCDMDRFRIRTNWTNSISESHEFSLIDLRNVNVRNKLKWAFSDPERLRPGVTRQQLTEQAAAEFAKLALSLRDRGHDPQAVAHFINRLVFCMFAESVDLLPNRMFRRMIEHARRRPDQFEELAGDLFGAMQAGGRIGFEAVDWFNGGLFDSAAAVPLTKDDITVIGAVAELDWSEIDPSILGTLFERGLDPDKRSQLGAHYTDRDKIMMIIDPVITHPWLTQWEAAKARIAELIERADAATGRARTRARDEAMTAYRAFLDRLRTFRVLDPACGSGNFLNLALLALKDLEHRVSIEAEAMGLQREFPQIGPGSVQGLEINLYAAELARVSVWIGEIQWMRRNGFGVSRDPILKPLQTIECKDAILAPDGSEAVWPAADVVIGNPPFLGAKWMLETLGESYTNRLRTTFDGRLPSTADLVTFWLEKARVLILAGSLSGAGFVTTNMIRGMANRPVMDAIVNDLVIFNGWSDEEWTVDGADVRVSLLCFAATALSPVTLDGKGVERIYPDISSGSFDMTKAVQLVQNRRKAIRGIERGGDFNVSGALAREWLQLPNNPNNRPNSDVLKPMTSGRDLGRRPQDAWVIDFGDMTEEQAALYEAVFDYALKNIKAQRANNREERTANQWWRHRRSGRDMRRATQGLNRFLVTGLVSKYRVFAWCDARVLPDTRLVVIGTNDDAIFGVLSSTYHEAWTLRTCTYHGVGNDPIYTPGTTFETFPFPDGLSLDGDQANRSPEIDAIAEAGRALNELRQNWLNPADLVRVVPEVVAGYPDRIMPVDSRAATILRKRTLTGLYNERPTWLVNAHRDLDAAVIRAYGWAADITKDEALTELFRINQARGLPPSASLCGTDNR